MADKIIYIPRKYDYLMGEVEIEEQSNTYRSRCKKKIHSAYRRKVVLPWRKVKEMGKMRNYTKE